jgi:hypothetical protein
MDNRLDIILEKLDSLIDDLVVDCDHPELGWPDPVARAGVNACIDRLRSCRRAIVREGANIATIYSVSDKLQNKQNKA